MRGLSELLGKVLLWSVTLWVGIIMIMPTDLRPAVACGPVVWLTRYLGDVVATAAGSNGSAAENAEVVGSFARGCTRVMGRYFGGGAVHS